MRLVIVTLPPLLRDIITALLDSVAAVTIVAEFDSRADAAAKLAGIAPDLIFVGLRPGETDDVGYQLAVQNPAAKVIAISSDGDNAYVHEMPEHRTVLRTVSPQALVAVVADRKPWV